MRTTAGCVRELEAEPFTFSDVAKDAWVRAWHQRGHQIVRIQGLYGAGGEYIDGTRDEGCLGYPESVCCPIAGRLATEREATPSCRIDVGYLDDVGLR